MRKAARSHVALSLALVVLTACQSADLSTVGPTATEPAQDQGKARTAADSVPVPGAPGSVPVPGAPNSVPVPGKPSRNQPGSQPTPTPGPTATPTPIATPTPAPAVTLSFSATDTPVVATSTGTGMRITSIIPVSGIAGPVVNITVALQATTADNSEIRDIRVLKSARFSQTFASSLYSDTFSAAQLSGANLGSNCAAFGGATTFDDRAGTDRLVTGTAPYAGVFKSEAAGSPLTAMATALRDPLDANGDWQIDFILEPGAAATLQCWSLRIQYQP